MSNPDDRSDDLLTPEDRRSLIEAVRTARTIMDTGWPASNSINVEERVSENMQRSGLIALIASHLIQVMAMRQRPIPDMPMIPPQVSVEAETVLAQSALNQELTDIVIASNERMDRILDALSEIIVGLRKLVQ